MPYNQALDNLFDSEIGSLGVSKSSFDKVSKEISLELSQLAEENIPLLDFSNIGTKISDVSEIVDGIKQKADTLFVLGTGGSTLCGQAICGLYENSLRQSKIKFVDNIDPLSFEFLIKEADIEKSYFLVISKSGNTIETITQFITFLNIVKKVKSNEFIKDRFLVITSEDNEENNIRDIAQTLEIPTTPHENVSGRFSIFSNVALIPAKFLGIDIEEYLKGAKYSYESALKAKENSEIVKGTAINHLFSKKNMHSTVMMPYVDKLRNFTTWFAQIWAESLGKDDRSLTPIRSLGTLDQHSQLQLFLDGKRDKIFNIISVENRNHKGENLILPAEIKNSNLQYLERKNPSDVIEAAVYSTTKTLSSKGLPVRSIIIDQMNEQSFGEVVMHFTLETILLAKYWGINPFNQPAVEQGKRLAVERLREK